jgi:translation elongation factor EF-Tu-like GTPase
MKAKFRILDTFTITGRGLVMAGYIEEGIFETGDYIEFSAFDKKRKRKITGISSFYKPNPHVMTTGLLIKCDDENEIDELRRWRPKDEVGAISEE